MEANQEHNTPCSLHLHLSFPQRVYNVLMLCEEQGREDIISWVNGGTAFKVNNLQKFERDLLPRYFNTKMYSSYTRALYAHGFNCVRTGRQTGIYSHPNFKRNDPLSLSLIKRVSKKARRKQAAPNHAVCNPFVESMDHRLASSVVPALSNRQQVHHFPTSLISEPTKREGDGGDTEAVLGREYHRIDSRAAADLVTSLPQMVAQRFDSDTNWMGMTSTTISNPASFHAAVGISSSNGDGDDERQSERMKPIAPNNHGSLFILGSGHMAPLVASSSRKEENKIIGRIPYHAPADRHSRLQEQDHGLDPITAVLPPNDQLLACRSHIALFQTFMESTRPRTQAEN